MATTNQVYVYKWKNNPKRETLFGRRCKVLFRSKMNSCKVEFMDDGQTEIVSRNSLDMRQDGERGGGMKYWAVTHRHTTFVEAETKGEALENCAQQVRDNADAADCEAYEIEQEESDQHWEKALKGAAV